MEAASVGSARRLYARFRQLIHEGAKFGIIGVTGVFIYNLVDNALLGIGPIKAATVARETVMFFALNGVGMLIQWAAVGLTYYGLGETGKLANFIANNIGIVLGTLFRFWSYRKWVWAAPRPVPSGHESIEPAIMATAPRGSRPSGDEAAQPH